MVSAAEEKHFLAVSKKIAFWILRISVTIGLFAYIFCYLIDFHDQVALRNGDKVRLLQRNAEKILVQGNGRSYWVGVEQINVGKGNQGIYPGLFSVVQKLNLGLFVAYCLIFFLAVGLATFRFKWLLQINGIFLPYSQLLKINFIGNFFNNFLPGFTGGDLVRGYYITRESRQLAKTVVCVLIDRIIGLTGLVMMAGVILIFLADRSEFAGASFIIFSAFAGIVVATIMLFLFPERLLSEDTRWGRLVKIVIEYRRHPSVLLKSLAITFIIHAITNIVISGFARALGIGHLPWYIYFTYAPVAILLMALPISVAGWGVGEAAFAYLFTQVGVTTEQAVVLALLFRVSQMIIGLAGGILWLSRPVTTEDVKN